MKAMRYVSVLMALATLISCGSIEKETPVSKFEIAVSSYNVPSEGGTVEISLVSTGAWMARCGTEWIKVLTSSGMGSEKSQAISVKVDPNDSSMDRDAQIVVSAGTNSSEVTIHQAGKETAVEPEPEPEPDYSVISSVNKDGEYMVKGTVVAAASTAYVIADETGALLVYDTDHDRRVMEIVEVKGTVSRYNGKETNVYQLLPSETKLISTMAEWTYSPKVLDASAMRSLLGKTASCEEVQLSGTLKIDGKYVNVLVEGISNKVSIYYIESEDYAHFDGKSVTVRGYVTGTYNYLYLLPYSVSENQDPDPEPDPEPEPTPDNNNDPRGKKWMELPAMNDASLEYYYHDFQMNSRTYRNYSFGWDDNNKVSFWMAYPLCSLYSNKKVSRTDAWAVDPLLGDASPYPGPGYAANYDRGHQVPSGDRLCCYDANAQTFYGTNMTAQSNPLNSGPWEALESDIRSFASGSDTTYVVTGCYVKDSSEWTTDTNGMRLKVPTAYFKAVLVLKNGNWTGGAYWTPHVGYSSSYINWAMSIDALEQKTGLDLFVNLPSKIGQSAADSIEAAKPGNSKWWN